MLEPRESDIPALFLCLVVLPVVIYILLGKWSDAAKRKERINVLAQLATVEAQRAEAMAAVSVFSAASSFNSVTHECVASSFENVTRERVAPTSKDVTHQCALCLHPATTRCSRCKSVRYCSGKCQIIHWRQGHKLDCQLLESSNLGSSPKPASVEESLHETDLFAEKLYSEPFRDKLKQPLESKIYTSIAGSCATSAVENPGVPMRDRQTTEKPRSANRGKSRKENEAIFDCSEVACGSSFASSTAPNTTKESCIKNKIRPHNATTSEGDLNRHNVNSSTASDDVKVSPKSSRRGTHRLHSQRENAFEFASNSGISSSLNPGKNGNSSGEINLDFYVNGGSFHNPATTSNHETMHLNACAETASRRRIMKSNVLSHSSGAKISKPAKAIMKTSGEQLSSEIKGHVAESNKMRESGPVPLQGSNVVTGGGLMKMMGLKKSKPSRQDASEVSRDKHEKREMLFPYEDFVKLFRCEFRDLSPRGLSNCGNSCYANAVLQCLTFTKPLIIYLLQRSHSRSCRGRNWCLMCELEQHLMMLRDNEGPISPRRILSQMQNINCQIGDGSQEDAHEFLRLLVTSMQSICLERLGGERVVDPRLQETTFIQHTFGGRLRSKVKCLKCQHESERYENIMDLTLEILGWVESLEDALTQFTTAEDLDGENMYRCGRCASYVRARKQLSIHEAPNILTIVLKRFQEGRYGKINKCITFPDMLDMIPFMTGTDDIPPLYILYAVVVHLDTQNASFSGHYVAYVKDLQGNWFRIDDSEVQPVPMCQVMSEGAYILFYMRSSPRPQRNLSAKASRQPAQTSLRPSSKAQKTAKPRHSKGSGHFADMESTLPRRQETTTGSGHQFNDGHGSGSSRNFLPSMEAYGEGKTVEFSDAASSDWSIFTSSDDASFTTESTRDSFSTIDYSDSGNIDSISSIFNTFHPPEYSARKPISCRMFSNSKGQTGFVSEERGFVLDSHSSSEGLGRVHRGEHLRQASAPTDFFSSDASMFVNYGSSRRDSLARTSCNYES